MPGGKPKKPTPQQIFAARRQDLLARIDDALMAVPSAKTAADDYLALKDLDKDIAQLAADIYGVARRGADEKRFWTAFGINTPLVAGLLLLEPFTGTTALLASVLTGYAPTVLIKRMLDDARLGDKAALKSVAMDIETLHIARTRLNDRCREVAEKYAAVMADAPARHELFRQYPDLRLHFIEKAMQARHQQPAPEPAADARAIPKNHRRFGL